MGLFLILAISVITGVTILSSVYVQSKDFNPGNTESNLLTLNNKKDFDYLFLGNSHARNFSRNNQHKNLEKELGGTVLNFGQGRGICGINDQYFYLKYLLNQGYSFKYVVHAVSPPYLFDDLRNQSTTTFFEEPFSLSFLTQYLKHPAPNKFARLVHYSKTKWKLNWLKLTPLKKTENVNALEKIDLKAVQKGFKIAHPNGLSDEAFESNKNILNKSIELAKSHGIQTILLQTPILFDAWPGQEKFNHYCKSLEDKNLASYIDLSKAIDEHHFFYDHHHLNTPGIKKILPQLKLSLDLRLPKH